jgi:hypothetical protein
MPDSRAFSNSKPKSSPVKSALFLVVGDRLFGFQTHAPDGGANNVAQVSNLLYRRLPVGMPVRNVAHAAGWKPAIQQTGSLRYGVTL